MRCAKQRELFEKKGDSLNVGHFALGHFAIGRFGPDISATDISATENVKVGVSAKTINCVCVCVWGGGADE